MKVFVLEKNTIFFVKRKTNNVLNGFCVIQIPMYQIINDLISVLEIKMLNVELTNKIDRHQMLTIQL